MLPSHFGWPHSTQPRRMSSVLTCLYRYCKGSASSGMTIPDCSCFIFSRFAAVGSLCRIVVRMRHRFLWSPMMLAWMYYMILYDILWYYMIFYVACIPTLEAIVCVAAFMRGRCTPLLHTIPRSHQQEAPTQFLSLRAGAQWTKHAVGDRRAGTAGTSGLAKSPRHAAIGISSQLHVYRHYVYKIGKHCLNYIHLYSFLHIYI
jgi:hypothetical protein